MESDDIPEAGDSERLTSRVRMLLSVVSMESPAQLLMVAGPTFLSPLEERSPVEAPTFPSNSDESCDRDRRSLETYLWSDAYRSGFAILWCAVCRSDRARPWSPRYPWGDVFDESSELWTSD